MARQHSRKPHHVAGKRCGASQLITPGRNVGQVCARRTPLSRSAAGASCPQMVAGSGTNAPTAAPHLPLVAPTALTPSGGATGVHGRARKPKVSNGCTTRKLSCEGRAPRRATSTASGCRLVAFYGTAVLAVVKELQVCVNRGASY